jgi:hypothetical protein
MTDVYASKADGVMMWWPMYRRGSSSVIVQNHIIVPPLVDQFSIGRLYDFVPPYSGGEPSTPVSEWHVSPRSMQVFLETSKDE